MRTFLVGIHCLDDSNDGSEILIPDENESRRFCLTLLISVVETPLSEEEFEVFAEVFNLFVNSTSVVHSAGDSGESSDIR